MSVSRKPPVETPREWFRYAEEDLGVAEREMGAPEPSFRTLCFLCQSAAEKFMKGYLIAHGWELERTHDMIALLNVTVRFHGGWEELLTDCTVLNEYVVAGRYPGDLAFECIGPAEAQEALEAAQHIREYAKRQMQIP